MVSKKHTIACRISEETYNAMMELVNGKNAKFETISEYMYTLIISDIARRKAVKPDLTEQLIEALDNPVVIDRLRNLVK